MPAKKADPAGDPAIAAATVRGARPAASSTTLLPARVVRVAAPDRARCVCARRARPFQGGGKVTPNVSAAAAPAVHPSVSWAFPSSRASRCAAAAGACYLLPPLIAHAARALAARRPFSRGVKRHQRHRQKRLRRRAKRYRPAERILSVSTQRTRGRGQRVTPCSARLRPRRRGPRHKRGPRPRRRRRRKPWRSSSPSPSPRPTTHAGARLRARWERARLLLQRFTQVTR